MSSTVRALRDIGITARGLAPRGIYVSSTGLENYHNPPKTRRVRAISAYLVRVARIWRALLWADTVHWHYHWGIVGALDVRMARKLNKKLLVEFHGSDIRIPEIEAADNRYYRQVMTTQEYREGENLANSRRRQTRFASQGAAVNLPLPGMPFYLLPNLFSRVYSIPHRIYLPDYTPAFPDPNKADPLVVHSPTAPIIKGTAAVLAAAQQVAESSRFELAIVENKTHSESEAMIKSCDIFLDQFVLGGLGVAALEAMAFGKPVVCYIKPSLVSAYPSDLPIVNATQETLAEVLARLVQDGPWRLDLGRRGRAYVERYHDAHQLAHELVEVYQSL